MRFLVMYEEPAGEGFRVAYVVLEAQGYTDLLEKLKKEVGEHIPHAASTMIYEFNRCVSGNDMYGDYVWDSSEWIFDAVRVTAVQSARI